MGLAADTVVSKTRLERAICKIACSKIGSSRGSDATTSEKQCIEYPFRSPLIRATVRVYAGSTAAAEV